MSLMGDLYLVAALRYVSLLTNSQTRNRRANLYNIQAWSRVSVVVYPNIVLWNMCGLRD